MFRPLRQRLSDWIAPDTKQVLFEPDPVQPEPDPNIPMPIKAHQLHPLLVPLVSSGGSQVSLQHNKFGAALAFNMTVPVNTAVRARVKTVGRAYWTIKDQNDNIVYDSEGVGKGNVLTTAIHDFEERFDVNFFGAWELSRCVAGETFIHLVANDYGVVTGIEWLNPLDVTVFAPMGIRLRYDYNPHGENLQIPVENMVFDRELNLLDENAGQSPVEVAIRKAQTIINGDQTMLSHLKNNARAGMTISPAKATQNSPQQAKFTNEQMDQIQDSVMKTMMGSYKHNSTVIIPYPVDFNTYEIANIQPVLDLMDKVDKSIYEVLNVPPALAGNPDTSRFQRSEQDVIVFDNMIVNELLDIGHYMNRKVLPVYAPNDELRFEFDLSPFIHVSEEDLRISETAMMHYGQGIIDKRAVIQMNSSLYRNTGVDVDRLLKRIEEEEAEQERSPDPPPPDDDPEQELPEDEIEEAQEEAVDPQRAIKMDGAEEAFAYVPLFNQKTLTHVQHKVKKLFDDNRIEWQTPQTFHVTLCYALQLSDDAIKTIADTLDLYDYIHIGFDEDNPFGIFETPNGQALHLKVRHNTMLDSIQADLYDGFMAHAQDVSVFSAPSAWNPHITLAYIPNDISIDLQALNDRTGESLNYNIIQADSVVIGRDDYHPVMTLVVAEYIRSFFDDVTQPYDDWTVSNALAELKAFQKYIGNRKSVNGFEPDYLAGDIFDAIFASDQPRHEIDRHISLLMESQKSLGGLEEEFRRGVERILEQADSHEALTTQLDGLVTRLGTRAYTQGLEDSGVRDDPNASDRTRIGKVQNRQRTYIERLADTMFGDNPPSDAQMERKPDQWVNKTLYDFYYEGLLSGRRNPMLEWQYDPDKKNCKDCKRLNGQRHRADAWRQANWKPRDSRLECNGDECGCDLIRVVARSRGNF